MDVELLYFEGCPHWRTAAERMRQVAAEVGARVRHRRVTRHDLDEAAGFAGSPTILVDGHDPFPAGPRPQALSCRLYPTPEGPAGSPTVDQLRAALGSGPGASSASTRTSP